MKAHIQIVSTKGFINRLTGGKLTEKQTNRASAYLRAKGLSFYDDWEREHCFILDNMQKSVMIDALKKAFN